MLKQAITLSQNLLATTLLLLLFGFGFQNKSFASNKIIKDTLSFKKYKGKIVDSKTKKALVFASLTVNGTNISTVTNTQGEFLLKVPKKYTNSDVTISFLGYTSKVLNLSDFKTKTTIKLETYIEDYVGLLNELY